MTEKYELSRRKMLAGLGTVGVAGAGAGLGTSALYKDTEQITDNSITAGTLDMAVTGEIVAANQAYIDEVGDITGNPITADGAVKMGFDVGDFKPGDWFILCMTVDSVAQNPFYLTLHADDLVEFGGANPEPEGSNEANLGDKLLTSVWRSYDDSGSKSGLEGLDGTTNTAGVSVGTSYLAPNEDGSTSNSSVSYTDVREFHSGYGSFNGYASGDGVLVREQSGDPAAIGATDTSGILTDPDGDGEGELVFYMLFELPREVGNEVQGDTLSGSLRFNAEQVRNNGDPRSGRGDPGDLFVADDSVQSDPTGGIRETDSWITAGVSNGAGPKTVIRVDLDGDVYGGGNSGLGEWPSNANSYFMEANIDIDNNDGIDEAANDDDFRVGYAAANSGARAGAISNSTSGASGNGGYIRRNTGGSSAGDSANRTDVAEEDVPGFTAYESPDQLTYVFELDWSQIAGDSNSPTAQLGSAPTAIQINEVFGGDGGEGVGATSNSSNDGRGDIDNVTDSSDTLSL